jgi:type IV pilus assembly protein PilQ
MKKTLSALLSLVLLVCGCSAVFAAELLDVKPVVAGSAVTIEITTDSAMTYTYYKVPGQARAVVDIAEADPEKVEPLIVVNKGAVSSISVDKVQISGMVVSRIIFNLVSETGITVIATADRKKLTVTFGEAPAVTESLKPEPEPKPEPKAELPSLVPVAKVETPAATPPIGTNPDDDPLGLDEPVAKSTDSVAKAAAGVAVGGAVSGVVAGAAATVTRIPKLEPVVPVATPTERSVPLTVKEITTGASYIEIRANQPIADYKTTRMSDPDRLVIDIPADKISQKAKTYTLNKFGISKARIGVSPTNIRIVIDSGKGGFPGHTVSSSGNGLRINFK